MEPHYSKNDTDLCWFIILIAKYNQFSLNSQSEDVYDKRYHDGSFKNLLQDLGWHIEHLSYKAVVEGINNAAGAGGT